MVAVVFNKIPWRLNLEIIIMHPNDLVHTCDWGCIASLYSRALRGQRSRIFLPLGVPFLYYTDMRNGGIINVLEEKGA